MEYIQCTHCGKRYEVSDQIREVEGQFTTCQACSEKFLIVIHSGKKKKSLEEDDSTISTGSWDPSLTMPTESQEIAAQEKEKQEEYLDDDDGAQVLLALQVERKKKRNLYILVGLGVCVLVAGGWFFLAGDDSQEIVSSKQAATVVVKSVQEQDAVNAECRKAAALQWLLDDKAMHAKYSAEEFVRLVNSSEKQSDKVRKVCQNKLVIQNIITAATKQEKPDWFKAEIETIQASRKR